MQPDERRNIDAGSTTLLAMPFASSNRCTQTPSRPASWMTAIPTDLPVTSAAFARSRAGKPRNAVPSLAGDECFDILSLPGDSDVTNHVEWLNSGDTYSVASWPQRQGAGRVDCRWVGCVGFLLAMRLTTTARYQTPRASRSHIESLSFVRLRSFGSMIFVVNERQTL